MGICWELTFLESSHSREGIFFILIVMQIDFRILTTKFPITTVAKKNGMHDTSPTNIQSHIDSIHSPHSTRNTIINECIKSVKFHRGISPSWNRNTRSETYRSVRLVLLPRQIKHFLRNNGFFLIWNNGFLKSNSSLLY